MKTETAWAEYFSAIGAVWRYRPGGDHVAHQLDPNHAAGYFDSDVITNTPEYLTHACLSGLVPLLNTHVYDVLAAPLLPIRAGHDLALALGRIVGKPVLAFDVSQNRFTGELRDVRRAVVVTDDVHSGGSVRRLVEALEARSVWVAPEILALADVSDDGVIVGRCVRALARFRFDKWPGERCPLCAAGSPVRAARGNVF